MDWSLFNVITEQYKFFYPHLGMQNPINTKVNTFYSFPTICTTGVSSRRHLVQTAVSGTSSGVFYKAFPGLHLCWEHGELWPAWPAAAHWQWREHTFHWLMVLIWTTQTLFSFQSLAEFEWCGGSCSGSGNLGPSLVVCNAFPTKHSWEARYSIKKLLLWNLFPCWSD